MAATVPAETSATDHGLLVYHRRDCCILAGDTDDGGLDMEMPVAGLMMGMALRPRVAAGWWSLMFGWGWVEKVVGGMKGGEAELREKPGATVWGC